MRTPKSSAAHTYPSVVCKINLEKPTKKKDYSMTSRKSLTAMSARHQKLPGFQAVVSHVFWGVCMLWERFPSTLKASLQHLLPLPQQVCSP